MENHIKVRVTIWQPYFSGCMLAFGQSDVNTLGILDSDTELQREVFTWPVEEDVWAGLTDDTKRRSLQERFRTEFQPTRIPNERNMATFAIFVADLKEAIEENSPEWSVASSGIAENTPTAIMFNGLGTFYHQLEWLLEIFEDLPGASVSVL